MRIDGGNWPSWSRAIWLPGSPAASRRSISARLICWHVLHFLVTLLTLTHYDSS